LKKFHHNLDLDRSIQKHVKTNYRNSGDIQEAYCTRYSYVLSYIYQKQIRYRNELGSTLNSNKLADRLSLTNKDFHKIIDFFIDNKIIYKTANYSAGYVSNTYKINEIYLKKKWLFDELYSNNVVKKIIVEEKKQNLMPNTEFFQTYEKYLKEIDIKLYKISDNSFEDKFFVQPRPENRVYHQIATLKSEYRKYLTWEGKKLFQIDLVASQMFFIGMSYLSYTKDVINPDDITKYIELCKSGLIYEAIAKEANFNLTAANRSQFKKDVFTSIVFNQHTSMLRKDNKLAIAFNNLFPTMFQFIYLSKEKIGNSQFSINVQATEWNMIHNILASCYQKGIKAINIHDSVVFNNKDQAQQILDIFETEFIKKYNVLPATKFSKL